MHSRRTFLFGLGAVGVVSTLGAITTTPITLFQSNKKQWLVSCCSDNKGNYYAAAVNLQGELISRVSLPARGHDVIALKSKPGHALVFARRPGSYVLEVDFSRGEVVSEMSTIEGQRLYGHGVLIENDKVLITTENDYDNGKGLIVLRDRSTQQIIEQYDSGGIGPHQLAVMPNANEGQVVIANGGIQTHPEHGRKKLNLDTMNPNLTYMSLANGLLEGQYELENKQLSIRHLDVSSQGKVIAGLQYQGTSTDEVPLAIAHHGEEALSLLKAEKHIWRSMKHYTASVCINDALNAVTISCPKANLITYWRLDTNQFISSHKLKDGAGLATLDDKFMASTGRGRIISQYSPMKPYLVTGDFSSLRWDNHMNVISS